MHHDTSVCGRTKTGKCKGCTARHSHNWYTKHKIQINRKKKRYYEKNKVHILKWHREWNKEHGHDLRRLPKNRYIILKAYSKRREQEFTLSKEEFFQLNSNPCHYCNKSLIDETGGGLDRIDNSKGYVLGNVLPCCGICNKIRGAYLSVEEMVVVINALLEYRKSLGEE